MKKRMWKSAVSLALVLVLLAQLALPALAVGTDGQPYAITMAVYEELTGSYGAAWHCSEVYDGVLQVTTADDTDFSEAASYPATRETDYFGAHDYHAVATGLADNTAYIYRVGKEGAWSAICSFTTSPADGQAYTFLHLTDTQARTTTGFTTYESLGYLVDAAEGIYGDIPLIFHTGDLVDNAADESQWYAVLDDINADVPQNRLMSLVAGPIHESRVDSVAEHFTVNMPEQNNPGNGYYSYDYGDIHFVCLNVNDVTDSGKLAEEQIKWLKTDLGMTDRTWIIVGMHYSLFDNGAHRMETAITTVRDQLHPIFSEYDVDLVLSGHDHIYNRSFPLDADGNIAEDGVIYVEGGTGNYKHYGIGRENSLRVAAQYAPVDGGTDYDSTEIMFNALTVDGDTLKLEAYKGSITDTTGDTYTKIDTLTLTKDGEDRADILHKADLTYTDGTSIDVLQVGFAEKNDYVTATTVAPIATVDDGYVLNISADGKVQSELLSKKIKVTGGASYLVALETEENGLIAQGYYYAYDADGNVLAAKAMDSDDVIAMPSAATTMQVYLQISGLGGEVSLRRLSIKPETYAADGTGWTLNKPTDIEGYMEGEVAEIAEEGYLDPGSIHLTNGYYPNSTYEDSEKGIASATTTVSGLVVDQKYTLSFYVKGTGALDLNSPAGLKNPHATTYAYADKMLAVNPVEWTKVEVPLVGSNTTSTIKFSIDQWQNEEVGDILIDNICLIADGSDINLIENGNLYVATSSVGWYGDKAMTSEEFVCAQNTSTGEYMVSVALAETGYLDAGSLHYTSTYSNSSTATLTVSKAQAYTQISGMKADETYKLSFWIKGNGYLRVRVYATDTNSGEFKPFGAEGNTSGALAENWTNYTVSFVANAATSVIYLETTRYSNSDFYIDNIVLYDANDNAINLPNGNFTTGTDFGEKFENSDFENVPTILQNVAAAAEATVDGEELAVTLTPRVGQTLPSTLALTYTVDGAAVKQTAAADGDTYSFVMPPETDGAMTLSVSETEAVLTPAFKGATVTLGDCLDLNFYLSIPDLLVTDSIQVSFAMGSKTASVAIGTKTADGYYMASVEIAAKDMNNTVTARLVDGEATYAEKTYTIREYGEAILAGADYTDKEKAAAKAMLNYGAAAQTYFGVGGTPANENCAYTQAELDAVDFTAVTSMTAENPVDYAGATLLLRTKTAIRLYFYSQVDGSVYDETKDMYRIEIADLDALDLAKTQTVTAGTATYQFSALSLAKAVVESPAYSTEFKNLMKSLTLYAHTATALASSYDSENDETGIIPST